MNNINNQPKKNIPNQDGKINNNQVVKKDNNIQGRKVEKISISKIREMTSDKDLTLVRKVSAEWGKSAKGKIEFFEKKNEVEKAKLARDSHEVAEGIRYILSDKASLDKGGIALYTEEKIKKGDVAVYAAFDNRISHNRPEGNIQGLALVNLKGDSETAFVLDELIVNPERVKSICKPTMTPITGTGTKLLQTAAQKILNGNGKKELGTVSLETSYGFYEKLGFINNGGGGGSGIGMTLNEKALRELAAKKI